MDYLFLAVGVVGGACSDVQQHVIQVTQYSKREQLLDLLKTTGDYNLYTSKLAFDLHRIICRKVLKVMNRMSIVD